MSSSDSKLRPRRRGRAGKEAAGVNEEHLVRPRTRNVQAAREDRIRQFADLQRKSREWIDFVQLREWFRNATGRSAHDAEEALRDAVLCGDFEDPEEGSRILFLHPGLPLQGMRRSFTRDMLRAAMALKAPPASANEDGTWVWENYLAWCWISRDDARAWFESQNIEHPLVLGEHHAAKPVADRPAAGGMAQLDQPYLDEMADLIGGGQAKSVEAAAREVATRVPGPSGADSKATRLAKRYRRERQIASDRPRSEKIRKNPKSPT
jgi:hypothetical protein